MKQPRVLLVCAVDVSVGPLLCSLAYALRGAGAEVHVACSPGRELDRLAAEGFAKRPVRISRRVFSPRHVVSLAQLTRLIRREHYDFVHVHTPVAAVLGRVAARLSGTRPCALYTAHGFYFHDRMRPAPRKALIQIERFLGRCCTDFLFTVSAEDRETAVRERIMDAERTHCLFSLGVDLRQFDLTQPPQPKGSLPGVAEGDAVVAFVGRFVREKGVLDLLEAIAHVAPHVPGLRLLMIGDTLPSDRGRGIEKEIRDLIAARGIEKNVIFLGFRGDVPDLLRLVDVFALPSYREGMPLTILEAMAAARPVVATNIRGCREEVIDGVTGLLVEPGDIRGLAEAIRSLALDPERARTMGAAGRRRAETAFDRRRVLAEEVETYHRLAQEHGKPWGTPADGATPPRSASG